MIRDVVIAVDGTRAARSALRWAADLVATEEVAGRRVGAAMINVWRPTESVGIDGFGLLANGGNSERSQRLLDDLADEIFAEIPRASEIDHVVREGFPGRSILNEADNRNADLIVVGTRAEGAIRQALVGSVSQWIASHGDRVVAVIPAGADLIGSPTLVGFDGSPGSAGALRWALENCSGVVRVVTVIEDEADDETRSGRSILQREQASKIIGDRGSTRLEYSIVSGDPVALLCEMALDTSQVVLGARSDEFASAIWGSVTTQIVAVAPRPIIVVPPEY